MYNTKHSSSNTLTFNNIDISYGSNKIINNLTLDNINAGEVISIIGRNGVGKSSLVKALLNIIDYKGIITYNTKNIKEYDKNYISKIIGYVPQDYRIYTQITVIEAILLSLNINNKNLSISTGDIDTANDLLHIMDISHLSNQYCNSLSGGQSQIVSLAQALVNNPQILILDEPNSALDIHRQIELLDYVYQYAKKHNTIVINILHDLNLAVKYSDKIAIINKGKIHKQGNAKEVINQDILQNIFNIEADIIEHKGNNIIIPLHSIHTDD